MLAKCPIFLFSRSGQKIFNLIYLKIGRKSQNFILMFLKFFLYKPLHNFEIAIENYHQYNTVRLDWGNINIDSHTVKKVLDLTEK